MTVVGREDMAAITNPQAWAWDVSRVGVVGGNPLQLHLEDRVVWVPALIVHILTYHARTSCRMYSLLPCGNVEMFERYQPEPNHEQKQENIIKL